LLHDVPSREKRLQKTDRLDVPGDDVEKLQNQIAESHKGDITCVLIIDYVCRPYLPPNPNPLPFDLEPENIERVVLVVERESWSIMRPSS